MGKQHRFDIALEWTGNTGSGTSAYADFERSYLLSAEGKPRIEGSSDPKFRGDAERWNPEDMLVASLSACHMLWYLHLCSAAGVQVVDYTDAASGTMTMNPDGSGQFTQVTLRPRVTITGTAHADTARRLHHEANTMCFLARSMSFPVAHEPEIATQGDGAAKRG